LQPVHEALCALLDHDLVRQFADLAEQPRSTAAAAAAPERERSEFAARAWVQCEAFVRAAQKAYRARLTREGKSNAAGPADPAALAAAFRRSLRAAMRLPAVESLFPSPWPAQARSVLPSASPQLTATAIWGPVLAWCALELLAESIDANGPERAALDLFDRLRLRNPFAQSFAVLGFEGEEAWRAAARIKVLLLSAADVGAKAQPDSSDGADLSQDAEPERSRQASQPAEGPGLVTGRDFSRAENESNSVLKGRDFGRAENESNSVLKGHDFSRAENEPKSTGALAPEGSPAEAQPTSTEPSTGDAQAVLAPTLWLDPDVRWLTGVHESEGHHYLIREQYEELLWWLLMPSLLLVAADPARARAEVERMAATIEEALATAEAAGYRVDVLLGPALAAQAAPTASPETTEPEATPESQPSAYS